MAGENEESEGGTNTRNQLVREWLWKVSDRVVIENRSGDAEACTRDGMRACPHVFVTTCVHMCR